MACYEYQVKDSGQDDPEVAKAFWNEAKTGLANGLSPEDVISQMSEKSGLQHETIARILTQNKHLRSLTTEAWAHQAAITRLRSNARSIIRDSDRSSLGKMFSKVWESPRALLTIGHGGVIPFTHMKDSLYAIGEQKIFTDAVKRAYSYATKTGGDARWRADMAALKSQRLYNFADRAGLNVRVETQPHGIGKNWWTKKSFDALKPARLEIFSKYWDAVPREAKSLDLAKAIALDVNHATGTIKPISPTASKVTSALMFAPQLRFAKYMTAFVDPIKFLVKGGKASAAERYASGIAAKRWAKITALNLSILAVNQAFNQYVLGNKEKINWTDWSKADWLRMKLGGFVIPMSPLFEMSKLPFRVVATALDPKQKEKWKPISKEIASAASPSVSLVYGGITGKELYSGRRLPFRGLAQMMFGEQRIRMAQQSWKEYGTERLPIYAQPMVKALSDEGVKAPLAKKITIGGIESVLSGVAGTHAYQPN